MRQKRNELKSYNQAIQNKNRYKHYHESNSNENSQVTFKTKSDALKYRLSPEFARRINHSNEIDKYRRIIHQVISEGMTYSHLSFMKERILESTILKNSLCKLEKRFTEMKTKILNFSKNQIKL